MHIFSGLYKGRTISAPKGLKTRPTSGRLREALFNICQGGVEDILFLDLFAGSGAMGLEALSRGALHITFVDNSKESTRCIQSNLLQLKAEDKAKVIYGDVYDTLKKFVKEGRKFDIIYADPPYHIGEGLSDSLQVLNLVDNNYHLLKDGGSLFLEDATNALPESIPLKHLRLKSSRSMGRSALHHYTIILETTVQDKK